jgi:hypothetical protein
MLQPEGNYPYTNAHFTQCTVCSTVASPSLDVSTKLISTVQIDYACHLLLRSTHTISILIINIIILMHNYIKPIKARESLKVLVFQQHTVANIFLKLFKQLFPYFATRYLCIFAIWRKKQNSSISSRTFFIASDISKT